MPSRPAVLAIDIGTSSSRAAVHDARGRRLPGTTFQFAYPLQAGADGRAELRPADIARAVDRAVAGALKAYGRPVAAVGVSCFWHSLLGLDGKGRPVTPVYTWADSRCRDDAARLRAAVPETALHARTGCMARASFWPAKLLWLRRTQPALWKKAARWVSPAEWIQERWCGGAAASLSMASGTGLLDARALKWDAPLLHRCRIKARTGTSRLNPVSDAPRRLSARAAAKFPALREAVWLPAIGDGAASNLGSDATAPGVAAINVGTSAALRVVVPAHLAKKVPYGLFDYRIDGKRRLVGGAVSNAGNLRAWALRELRLPDNPAAIENALAKRPLPVPGLTLLPFWMAERAPTWPEELPSAVVGITQATTALDLLQALQEGTYHRLARIAGEVEKAAGRRLSFIVSGGIQHSPDSLQRLADALGRTVYASAEPEASLRGAALFALGYLGEKPPRAGTGRAIRPRPAAAKAQAAARERQNRLEAFFGALKR